MDNKKETKDCATCDRRTTYFYKEEPIARNIDRCMKYSKDITVGGSGLTHWYERLDECKKDAR